MPPELSIIIVSYNCSAMLSACLASVDRDRSETSLPVEVIVVDNASADDTVQMLQVDFPEVTVIANPLNAGFSVANNQGICAATGRYVMLLNPDTEITHSGTLSQFINYMDTNPEVGACGGQLVFENGHKQVSGGHKPGPATLFAFSFFLAKITGNALKGLSLLPSKTPGQSCVEIDWICAACMVVRRETMADAGLLDESYFLYGEDIEWGCRISNARWKVCHLPWIEVTHIEAGTQQKQTRVSTAWVNGMARTYMQLNPTSSWLYFKACLGMGLALRALLYGSKKLLSNDPWAAQRTLEMSTWLKHLVHLQRPTLPTLKPGRCASDPKQ